MTGWLKESPSSLMHSRKQKQEGDPAYPKVKIVLQLKAHKTKCI